MIGVIKIYVVLCESFEEVQSCFADFLDFLETCEPGAISRVLEYSYAVDTNDGIRYVFSDYRFKDLFFNMDSGVYILYADEFFNDMGDYYFQEG